MSSRWLLILLFLSLLPLLTNATEEETGSLDIVGQKGMIFDHEGKYVKTESVWMYVLVFSTILSLILLAGCINLCWIRWHYRRKCSDIMGKLEKQHKRRLETKGEPSPFGVPIKTAVAAAVGPEKPKETVNAAWDPATLAQVLHLMVPDQAAVQRTRDYPYQGVALGTGEQPQPRDPEAQTGGNNASTVGQSSNVQAGSHG